MTNTALELAACAPGLIVSAHFRNKVAWVLTLGQHVFAQAVQNVLALQEFLVAELFLHKLLLRPQRGRSDSKSKEHGAGGDGLLGRV